MKKILTIFISIIVIGFIFYGAQSVVKRFNLNKNNININTSEDIIIDKGHVVIGPENTKALNHLITEAQIDNNQQVQGDVAPIIEESEPDPEIDDITQDIKIKIIKKPLGEEPDWVKQAWVGLEIPVIKGSYAQKGGQEVLSGDFRAADNYVTYVNEALAILKAKNPEAEKWWQENVDLTGVDYIAFDQSVCELIGAD